MKEFLFELLILITKSASLTNQCDTTEYFTYIQPKYFLRDSSVLACDAHVNVHRVHFWTSWTFRSTGNCTQTCWESVLPRCG